jgi:hypothetical protein
MTNKILILLLILLSVILYIQREEYKKTEHQNKELIKDIKTVHDVTAELKSLDMILGDDTCLEEDLLNDYADSQMTAIDSELYKDPYEQTLDSILAVTSKYITKN